MLCYKAAQVPAISCVDRKKKISARLHVKLHGRHRGRFCRKLRGRLRGKFQSGYAECFAESFAEGFGPRAVRFNRYANLYTPNRCQTLKKIMRNETWRAPDPPRAFRAASLAAVGTKLRAKELFQVHLTPSGRYSVPLCFGATADTF